MSKKKPAVKRSRKPMRNGIIVKERKLNPASDVTFWRSVPVPGVVIDKARIPGLPAWAIEAGKILDEDPLKIWNDVMDETEAMPLLRQKGGPTAMGPIHEIKRQYLDEFAGTVNDVVWIDARTGARRLHKGIEPKVSRYTKIKNWFKKLFVRKK